MKTLEGVNYYALICDNEIICGVYSTRKEAEEVADKVKDCPCKHKVQRCNVIINYKT